MKNFEQTNIFLNQLEMMEIIQKEDMVLLENQPSPEDVFDTLLLQGKSDVKLSEAYARFRSIAFVHVHEIAPEAREIIDEGLARKFGFVPFYVDHKNKILQIAVSDPRRLMHLNDHQLSKLSKKIGFRIEVMMAAKSQVDKALTEKPKHIDQTIKEQGPAELPSMRTFNNPVNIDLIKTFASQGDHVSLTLAILKYAFDRKAEEVLIEPFEKKLSIKLKIDGANHNMLVIPSILLEGIVSQVKSIATLENEEAHSSKGLIALNLGSGSATEISVRILPTIFGPRINFKFLLDGREIPTLEKLGMFEKNREVVEEALSGGYGLVLVGGVGSSGKTTTLYSMANFLSSKELDVIALEGEVSYRLQEVSQVEIKPELGFGYSDAIRSSLSQSPDALMIDSLSDSESAKLALEGSLTGKLILAGLYARTASQTLGQFAGLSEERFLLSSAIKLIISQCLVRRICPHCRVQIRISQSAEEKVKRELNTSHDLKFYKGAGCDKCKNGFRGRIAIFEIISPTPELIEIVARGGSAEEISQASRRSGMISMRQDGLLKVVSGLTTIDEVIKATKSEE